MRRDLYLESLDHEREQMIPIVEIVEIEVLGSDSPIIKDGLVGGQVRSQWAALMVEQFEYSMEE